jgi:hypothetical protein
MEHSRRFWVLTIFLAAACGGRTLLPSEDEGSSPPGTDGGTGDGCLTCIDAPRSGVDSPISTIDSIVPPPEDAPIMVFDGGEPDVIGPFDAISPPPFEGGVDVISFDSAPEDAGFPDVSSPDTGSEGGEPVFCGGVFCLGGDECCVTISGGGTSASCVAPGTCDMGISLACTGSDNCPSGDVCCGTLGFGGGNASCQPGACDPGSIQLCTVDGDCPAGENCDPTPIGLSVCRHHH